MLPYLSLTLEYFCKHFGNNIRPVLLTFIFQKLFVADFYFNTPIIKCVNVALIWSLMSVTIKCLHFFTIYIESYNYMWITKKSYWYWLVINTLHHSFKRQREHDRHVKPSCTLLQPRLLYVGIWLNIVLIYMFCITFTETVRDI